MLKPSDRYFDLKALSEVCCLSVRTLRYLIKDEGLPCFRVGQKILVYYPDFHRWMQNHQEKSVHPEAEEIADEILKDLR
jgi:hypothetical protein